MEHIALYRQFRPMNFDEMVEQDAAVTTLRQAVITGKIGHAYLFCGQRGTGKTSIARVFARAINCEKPVNGNPCNSCPTCKGILDGSLMDVIEIDAASNTSVDNIKKICEEVNYAPSRAPYKVYIIDEVHMLSKGASNALLKTLEEPPKHAVFLFATTEIHKILPTIISRCQRYDFRRITSDAIVKRLEFICSKEKIKADKDALILISSLSDGAMRDALSLLDQAASSANGSLITAKTIEDMTGTVNNDFLSDMSEALIKSEYDKILVLCGKLSESGKDTVQFTLDLARFFRDLLVIRVIPHPAGLVKGSAGTIRRMYDIAGLTNTDTIVAFISFLSKLVSELKWSPSPKTTFEISMLRLAGRKVKAEVKPLVMPEEFKDGKDKKETSEKKDTKTSSGILADALKISTTSPEKDREEKKDEPSKPSILDSLKAASSISSAAKEEPKKDEPAKPSSEATSPDQAAHPSPFAIKSKLDILKSVPPIAAAPEKKETTATPVPSILKPKEDGEEKKDVKPLAPSSDFLASLRKTEPKKEESSEASSKPAAPASPFAATASPAPAPAASPAGATAAPADKPSEAEPEPVDPEDIPMENQIDIFSIPKDTAPAPAKKKEEPKKEEPSDDDDDKVFSGIGESILDESDDQHAPTGRIGETRRSSLAVAIEETPIATRKGPQDPYEVWDEIIWKTSAEDPDLAALLRDCGFKVEGDCIYMVFPNSMGDTVKSLRSNSRYKSISSELKERVDGAEHVYLCTDTQYENAMSLSGKKPAPAESPKQQTPEQMMQALLQKSEQMGIATEIHFGDD